MPQPPNMNKMLQQVQKMQQDMMAAQEQLKNESVESSAGGGMVKVVVSGDLTQRAKPNLATCPGRTPRTQTEAEPWTVPDKASTRGSAPGT